MKSLKILSILSVSAILMAVSTAAVAKPKERTTGRGTGPVVYVTSQGLYYDSIVIVDSLPMKGRFQQLIPGEMGLMTEFGPGDHGHVGGRWWIDLNENEMMDAGDMYVLCPVLGPGRPTM